MKSSEQSERATKKGAAIYEEIMSDKQMRDFCNRLALKV